MFPNVYLFNPDYDMAMADFTPYYKSPAEIMRMIADLSVLPWWFAEEGNCVKVENMALVSLLQKQLREVCGGSMEVERRLDELLPRAAWTAEWPSVRYIPWGWTPALVHRLRQEGVEECFLPSEEAVRRFRFLSSRQRCLEVLPELLKIDGTCGEMKACVSLSELEAFLQERGELVLKAPWSGSGRGLLKVSSASWNTQLAGWAARILRVQGAVMAEPIYDKAVDFAMEFYVEKQNGVRFGGYWWLAHFCTSFCLQLYVNQLLAKFCSMRKIPDGTKTGQNHRKIKSRTLQARHPLSWTSLFSAKVRFCPVKNKQNPINMLSINHLYHICIFGKILQVPHAQTRVAYSKGLLKSVLCHLYTKAFPPMHIVLDKCTTFLPLSEMLDVCSINLLVKNATWHNDRTKRHI